MPGCRLTQQLLRATRDFILDLCGDRAPKVEPLTASRATRLVLLQNGQLICSDFAVLSAQTLHNGQYAHTERNRLHFGQF